MPNNRPRQHPTVPELIAGWRSANGLLIRYELPVVGRIDVDSKKRAASAGGARQTVPKSVSVLSAARDRRALSYRLSESVREHGLLAAAAAAAAAASASSGRTQPAQICGEPAIAPPSLARRRRLVPSVFSAIAGRTRCPRNKPINREWCRRNRRRLRNDANHRRTEAARSSRS